MLFLLIALSTSFLVTLLLVRFESTHRDYSVDRNSNYVHRVSVQRVTRIGGVGVFFGILLSWCARLFDSAALAVPVATQGLLLTACVFPTFAAGVLEDLTKRGWNLVRFAATLVSAALAGVLLDGWISRVDMPLLDTFMTVPAVAIVFTCLAVAGVTNAFNIIDGFNGLACGVATIILLAITYVAFKNGDTFVMAAGLTGVGAILGFMLWNFPRGLIYLGDCGAYLLGFWVAELSVLLVVRNPQVSAWFPLVLCAYPVFETLFSIYRRTVLRGAHATRPDVAHLHHMIYRRLVRWAVGTRLPARRTERNSITSPYLWILTSIAVGPALTFWSHTLALQICAFVFAALYLFGYARIVRFKVPRWWVIRKS